jgi:hypothetical protein
MDMRDAVQRRKTGASASGSYAQVIAKRGQVPSLRRQRAGEGVARQIPAWTRAARRHGRVSKQERMAHACDKGLWVRLLAKVRTRQKKASLGAQSASAACRRWHWSATSCVDEGSARAGVREQAGKGMSHTVCDAL